SRQHAPGGEPRGAIDPRARRLPRAPSRGADSRQDGGEVMARRIARMLSIAIVAASAGGCASPASRFYTLDSTAADGAGHATYAVTVDEVSIPAAVDRPEFVVQVSPNQVAVDEFNRWAAPLGDSIAQVVAGDLQRLLGTPKVAVGAI